MPNIHNITKRLYSRRAWRNRYKEYENKRRRPTKTTKSLKPRSTSAKSAVKRLVRVANKKRKEIIKESKRKAIFAASQARNVAKKTTNLIDVVTKDRADYNKMDREELLKYLKVAARTVNNRAKKLEEKYGSSAFAADALKKSGGYIKYDKNMTLNEARREMSRALDYLDYKTGKISDYKKFIREMNKRFAAGNKSLQDTLNLLSPDEAHLLGEMINDVKRSDEYAQITYRQISSDQILSNVTEHFVSSGKVNAAEDFIKKLRYISDNAHKLKETEGHYLQHDIDKEYGDYLKNV